MLKALLTIRARLCPQWGLILYGHRHKIDISARQKLAPSTRQATETSAHITSRSEHRSTRSGWLCNVLSFGWNAIASRACGHPAQRQLARQIVQLSDELKTVSDQQLLQISRQLQATAKGYGNLSDATGGRVASRWYGLRRYDRNSRATAQQSLLRALLPMAYAVVRESARRAHRQAHYEVQIMAGIGLFKGGIIEMQTGEGKTLAVLLPAYLHSLAGKGCHIVTANDYLAQRDASFASAVLEPLGVSVGCVVEGLPRDKRRAEYDAAVTYGTAREFGFDFLKDRLAGKSQSAMHRAGERCDGTVVQRGHYFALVDEADSVLIDDARTPLLIANQEAEDPFKQQMIRACHQIALGLDNQEQFELNHNLRSSALTKRGCLSVLGRCPPEFVRVFGSDAIYRQVENSLCANYLFQSNRHYIVDAGKVVIVDESTGRVADGRKWQSGLHQAIEAKAGVAITAGTQTMARITVQSYFRNYLQLAGLTGTAGQVAREFKKVYRLSVTPIPTRKPSRRSGGNAMVFQRFEDKAKAIAVETMRRLIAGQAVLIGTPSVTASQKVSQTLAAFEIEHQVLNCFEHESESKIIEQAGQPGRVTVATNMAGRGTDIHVSEAVLRCGGLHIIATAKHSSSRIDRQLIGRTARQGQPGTYQFILSLEDELFSISGNQPKPAARAFSNPTRIFDQAQSKLERLHEKQRMSLLQQEKKRSKICRQTGLDPCLEMLEE